MMTKAVFFDIDDTLVDTSSFADLARHAAIESMCNNGLPLEPDEAYDLLKDIIKDKGSNYSKHFNILTEEVLGKEDPLLVAIGMTTYHNVKFALLRPFPRTSAILIYLKSKGYKLGAITNGITIKQWEKLVRLGLYPFFDIVITSESVGVEKPDPEIFKIAMKRLNVSAGSSLMIGNSFETDILGACNAGIQSMIINSEITGQQQQLLNEKGYRVRQLSSLIDLMKIL